MDLKDLSSAALSAAMRGGTDGWGRHGSAYGHVRYLEPVDGRSRRRCHCGCGRRATHRGKANGVALITGCELSMQRWCRNVGDYFQAVRRSKVIPSP
jgi:hypothetical protein